MSKYDRLAKLERQKRHKKWSMFTCFSDGDGERVNRYGEHVIVPKRTFKYVVIAPDFYRAEDNGFDPFTGRQLWLERHGVQRANFRRSADPSGARKSGV